MDWRVIRTPDDFEALGVDLRVVVDPMMVRAVQVFIRGSDGLEPDQIEANRRALAENVSTLRDFIDTIVLHPQIPVFDYPATYGPDSVLGDAAALWEVSDELGLGLVPVAVEKNAYLPAKAVAIRELSAALSRVSTVVRAESSVRAESGLPALLTRISEELQTFEYQWEPDLGDLAVPDDVRNLTAARFAFGERLFDVYARLSGGIHVLQTKRLDLAQRLYLPKIDPKARDVLKEPGVLRKLVRSVNKKAERPIAADLVIPSFLEFLIAQQPADPRDLLRRAVELRDHEEIRRHAKLLERLRATAHENEMPAELIDELAGLGGRLRDVLAAEFKMKGGILDRIGVVGVAGAPTVTTYALEGFDKAAIPAAASLTAVGAAAFLKYLFGETKEQRAYRRLLTDLRRETQGWGGENTLMGLWEQDSVPR